MAAPSDSDIFDRSWEEEGEAAAGRREDYNKEKDQEDKVKLS